MLESPTLSAQDKAAWRLALEARTFVGAGTETTGNTLTVTMFHLLDNPEMFQKLKTEIQEAQRKSKGHLGYRDLQQLPFLVRTIFHINSKGLRLIQAVFYNFRRSSVSAISEYKQWRLLGTNKSSNVLTNK